MLAAPEARSQSCQLLGTTCFYVGYLAYPRCECWVAGIQEELGSGGNDHTDIEVLRARLSKVPETITEPLVS